MSADFTPTRGSYKETGSFRFWCQKVLPTVYNDSLSYYELLCKVVNYLNDVIQNVDTLNDDMTALYGAYDQLQEYVNNYFDNLDVQQEINNKLDDLVDNGTMSDLLKDIYGATVGVTIVDSQTEMTDPTKVYVLSGDANGYLWFWNGSTFEQSTMSYINPINALAFVSSSGLTDCNDLYRKCTNLSTGQMATILNVPPSNRGVIICDLSPLTGARLQIAFNYAYNTPAEMWVRKSSNGTNWSEWTYYNAESYLAFLGALTSADLNTAGREVFNISSENLVDLQNGPDATRGLICVTYRSTSEACVQMAFDYAYNSAPLIWVRKYSPSQWGEWFEITGSGWTQIRSGDLNNYKLPKKVFWITGDGKNIVHSPVRMLAGYCVTEYGYPRGIGVQVVRGWGVDWAAVECIRVRQDENAAWGSWAYKHVDQILPGYGFTVIGDSLSSGVVSNASGNLKAYNLESWEKILANKWGCKVYAATHSGYSTVEWLDPDNDPGITKYNTFPATPITFINLGINDLNDSVDETTFKANYNTIINLIKAKNANTIIFCMTLWRSARYDEFTQYIRDVLDDYTEDPRVLEFDIQASVLAPPISTHLYQGHFDVIGYKYIADAVEAKLLEIANAKPELFRQPFSNIAEGTKYQNNGYPYAM